MPVRTLPMPTWHGSDGNLLSKYLKFLKGHHHRYNTTMIQDLEYQISELYQSVAHYQRTIATEKATINQQKIDLTEQRERIVTFSDEQLLTSYRALIELPEVIGTRVDANGALVVLLRPIASRCDVGDFESDLRIFNPSTDHDSEVLLTCNRSPRLGYVNSPDIEHAPEFDDLVRYRVTVWKSDSYEQSLRDGLVYKAVNALLARFAAIGDEDLQLFKQFPTVSNEQAWEGYVENPIKALRRQLDRCLNADTHQQVAFHETMLQAMIVKNQRTVGSFRSAQRKIRALGLNLSKLRTIVQQSHGTVDRRVAADDLRRITTAIPSIMGLRFDDSGIAMVHVRSSVVIDGNRYDYGDYELYMILGYADDGVIQIRQTRAPASKDPNHPNPPYWIGDYFCFGERRTELYKLFIEGNFAQFVHIAVNSMNNVNSDETARAKQFAVIPIDEVWLPKRRQRPRRVRAAA